MRRAARCVIIIRMQKRKSRAYVDPYEGKKIIKVLEPEFPAEEISGYHRMLIKGGIALIPYREIPPGMGRLARDIMPDIIDVMINGKRTPKRKKEALPCDI